MSFYEGITYYRNERYLAHGVEPKFARCGTGTPFPAGSEFRLDGDHWTRLSGMPVLGWLLDGDAFLEETPEEQMPLALTPETVR